MEQAKQFNIQIQNREVAEFILGRKLTNKTWQTYVTSESRRTYIAIQVIRFIQLNICLQILKKLRIRIKKRSHNLHFQILLRMLQRKRTGKIYANRTTTSE